MAVRLANGSAIAVCMPQAATRTKLCRNEDVGKNFDAYKRVMHFLHNERLFLRVAGKGHWFSKRMVKRFEQLGSLRNSSLSTTQPIRKTPLCDQNQKMKESGTAFFNWKTPERALVVQNY
jgi:hypothetical protein